MLLIHGLENSLRVHLAIPWTRRTTEVSVALTFAVYCLHCPDERHLATPPQRSVLHPPKQAPSVWQIFFTDWLQKQKSSAAEGKKLNVAQEAKEAGHVYNELSEEAREVRPTTPDSYKY
jgi:hypothetical protein